MGTFFTVVFLVFCFVVFLIATTPLPKELKDHSPKEKFNPYPEREDDQSQVLHLYNGGYKTYLTSPEWKSIASKVRARDKACVICGSVHGLQVHHTTYKNVFYEDTHLDDLITLCSDCHRNVNHRPILNTWPGT